MQMQELDTSPDKGSLLDFTRFYVPNAFQFNLDANGNEINGLYAFYCIDLAHVQNRVDDQAINLMINAVKSTVTSSSVLYYNIIERETCALFEYNRNSCTVTVGSMID